MQLRLNTPGDVLLRPITRGQLCAQQARHRLLDGLGVARAWYPAAMSASTAHAVITTCDCSPSSCEYTCAEQAPTKTMTYTSAQ